MKLGRAGTRNGHEGRGDSVSSLDFAIMNSTLNG